MVRSVRLCPRYSAMRPAFSFRRSFLLSAQRNYNSGTDYPNFSVPLPIILLNHVLIILWCISLHRYYWVV